MKKPLVTKVEKIETARVEEARSKAKSIVFTFLLVAFAAVTALVIVRGVYGSRLVWLYVLLFVAYFIINNVVHHKFDELMKTAKMNDTIRHEEKVRAMERDRFEQGKEIERLQQEIEALKAKQK